MLNNRVSFNSEYCKGCELCMAFCPVSIIKLDKSSINSRGYYLAVISQVDMAECIACGNCATMCPDSVITIVRGEPSEQDTYEGK